MTRRQFLRLTAALPLTVATFAVLCFGAFFIGQNLGAATIGTPYSYDDETVMADRPAVEGSPAALVEAHDCWTGEAPADVEVPGHVVVTVGNDTIYGGPRLVGKALSQIFDGANHGLVVHGFCR